MSTNMIGLRALTVAAPLILFHLPVAVADPEIPPLSGRVVDLADVLTGASERDLTSQLAKIEQRTGTQIVVATLPKLGGYPIETWGLALGRGWKIGHQGRDDGIVIVLAPNDHEVRIEVGYGLEGWVPDAAAHKIIETYMLPAAREGRYATALEVSISALERVLIDPDTAFPAKPAALRIGNAGVVFLLGGIAVFALFVVVLNIGFRRSQTYPARPDERATSVLDDKSDNSWARTPSGSLGSSHSSFSGSGSSFSGGGGSFGGGGATGKW